MNGLEEGELIKRTLIQHIEGLGATKRKLLDIMAWLSGYHNRLNNIYLRALVLFDIGSAVASGDAYELSLKTYGMKLSVKSTGYYGYSTPVHPITFPLATIGIPGTATDMMLEGQFHNWLATETHRALITVQAYLMPEEVGPRQMTIRSYV